MKSDKAIFFIFVGGKTIVTIFKIKLAQISRIFSIKILSFVSSKTRRHDLVLIFLKRSRSRWKT